MSPGEAIEWLEQKMLPYYPLGVFKDPEEPELEEAALEEQPLEAVANPGEEVSTPS